MKTFGERFSKVAVAFAGWLMLACSASTAWAVTFTAQLQGSFPVQVTQGQTVNSAFQVNLGATGNFSSQHSGKIIVCSAITLHADGTTTCTQETEFTIQNANHTFNKNNNPNPPTYGPVQVSITVDSGVQCTPPNNVYQVSLGVRLEVTGGADFGKDENDQDIRQLALPFSVEVLCASVVYQGCSQGYWKTDVDHHAAVSWTGLLSPTDTLGSVFAAAATHGLQNHTLAEALDFGGGPTLAAAAKLLLKQAVAAVLNALHSSVNYPRAAADIVTDVNNALNSGSRATIESLQTALDGDNNRGCPLTH